MHINPLCPGLQEKLTSSLFLRHMKLELKYSYFKSTPNLKSVTYWNINDKHASLLARISVSHPTLSLTLRWIGRSFQISFSAVNVQ